MNEEQIKRVVSALKGDCLEWETLFSGRSIEIVNPDNPMPDIDRDAIDEKRSYELSKLEEVINFARHNHGCRQAELISYFGEHSRSWHCGICDCCNEQDYCRELDEHERTIAHTILSAVACFDGRTGANLLAKIITGHESITGFRRRSPAFGTLRREKQTRIIDFISAMERAGYLERQDCAGFPCLALTDKGRNAIFSPESIRLEIASAKPEKSNSKKRIKSSTQQQKSSPCDLLSVLTALRNKIADSEHQPRFKILSNATLEALAKEMPSTPEEAAEIQGIGPVKMRTVIPAMLEAIRLWKLAVEK